MLTEPKREFSEILRRHSPMVLRLAYARTRCMADAEDLCQEVMLRLYRANPSFDSEEHVKAWLIRTTLYLSGNIFRSAWRKLVTLTDSPPEPSAPAPAESPLSEALDRLPGKYRAVIHLFYYEEMSVQEISDTLKLRPSTVRTQLTRARRLLKTDLESKKGAHHVQRCL